MMNATLTGRAAIALAKWNGAGISKYADPTEGARKDLTPDEAIAVEAEDPSLVYLTMDAHEMARDLAGQAQSLDASLREGDAAYVEARARVGAERDLTAQDIVDSLAQSAAEFAAERESA